MFTSQFSLLPRLMRRKLSDQCPIPEFHRKIKLKESRSLKKKTTPSTPMCHFTQTLGGRRNCANPAEQAHRGPVRPFLPAPPRTTPEGGHICFSVSPSECPHSGLGAGRPFPPNTLALPLPGRRRLMGGKHTSMNLSAACSSVNSKRGALA